MKFAFPANIDAEIQAFVNGDNIELRTRLCNQFYSEVVRLQDECVKDALAKFGWASPERHKELVDELVWVLEEVWPLVHLLNHRQTVKARFLRLADVIAGVQNAHPNT